MKLPYHMTQIISLILWKYSKSSKPSKLLNICSIMNENPKWINPYFVVLLDLCILYMKVEWHKVIIIKHKEWSCWGLHLLVRSSFCLLVPLCLGRCKAEMCKACSSSCNKSKWRDQLKSGLNLSTAFTNNKIKTWWELIVILYLNKAIHRKNPSIAALKCQPASQGLQPNWDC